MITIMKNVIKPQGKNVLIPLGLTAVASAADEGIHKKIWRSAIATLIISNDEIKTLLE